MRLHEELNVHCPYCDAPIVIEADPQLAGQQFIEDCPVCCAPIELHLALAPDGSWQLAVRRDNE